MYILVAGSKLKSNCIINRGFWFLNMFQDAATDVACMPPLAGVLRIAVHMMV